MAAQKHCVVDFGEHNGSRCAVQQKLVCDAQMEAMDKQKQDG